MNKLEDDASLQARFERNAPTVDARKDWTELRSRMLEHHRKPARRRLHAAAISFAVIVLVAAVAVGGVEAYAHLGTHGQRIIMGGDTTSASAGPVTTVPVAVDLGPADRIDLADAWLMIGKGAGFDAQNAVAEAVELDFAPTGSLVHLRINARTVDNQEITVGWDGYGGAADQTVHVTGTVVSPVSRPDVDMPLPIGDRVYTVLFAVDGIGAEGMMGLAAVEADGYLRLVPYLTSRAQGGQISASETAYLYDGSFKALAPTDGRRKADTGFVRLAAMGMVPGSPGGADRSLVGKTKTNFVIAANTGYTTTTSTAAAVDSMTISVYFTRGEKIAAAHRVIPKTSETGKAAMLALLDGPTAAESAAGLVGAIPEGTRFLNLSIDKGVATVNLSKEYESGGGSLSMSMRLAQVVFTLTQFPSVSKVSFQLEGQPVSVFGGEGIILDHPVGRADYEDMAPAILVESPTVGDAVNSPVRISGSANTFEATFTVDLLSADGVVIVEKQVTATSGTGQRGTFQVDIPFAVDQTGDGTLKVFEQSAKDGSPVNVVEIPIRLDK